ncbi:MAG: hypothetical protein HY956_02015, partial [Deltaproteobacteria bacterium]|nr:hypothetical protein [Deltaproteobacteria bacterium]
GEASLRRKQNGRAAHLFHMALGLDKEFLPPFTCASCSFEAKSWAARCPSCGEWNTLAMSAPLAKTLQPKPQAQLPLLR